MVAGLWGGGVRGWTVRAVDGVARPRYVVHEKLGEGKSSVVWRVSRDGDSYALKIPKDGGPWSAAEVRRQASVQAAIRHPSIPAFEELVVVHGRLAIVMEFVPGVTLDHLVRKRVVPWQQVQRYLLEVRTAAQSIFAEGISPIDLAPHNIMVTPAHQVKFVDLVDLRKWDLTGFGWYMHTVAVRWTWNDFERIWSGLYLQSAGVRSFWA